MASNLHIPCLAHITLTRRREIFTRKGHREIAVQAMSTKTTIIMFTGSAA